MKHRTKSNNKNPVVKKDIAKKEKNKQLLKNLPRTIIDLIPIKGLVDDGYSGFEYTDGMGYFNLFRIVSFDYPTMSDEELEGHILIWDKFLRVHSNDIKWIEVNMPIELIQNLSFYISKYNNNNNPMYKELIERNIKEFKEKLAKRETRDFYLFVYAESYDDIIKINASIRNGIERRGLVTDITTEQKIRVLRKFSNPYNKLPE